MNRWGHEWPVTFVPSVPGRMIRLLKKPSTPVRADNPVTAARARRGDSFVPGSGLRDTVVVATLKVSPEDAQKLAYADTFASDPLRPV